MYAQYETPRVKKADPVQREPLLEIKASARVKTNIPRVDDNGQRYGGRVGPGEVHCKIYQSDLAWVKDRVETEWEVYDRAKAAHSQKFAEHMRSKLRYDPGPPESWTDHERKVARRYTGSIEAEFHSLMRRGVKPLESVEVVAEHPPPEQAHVRDLRTIAESMAGVKAEMGENGAADLERLMDNVQKIEQRNKELERKVAELEGKKGKSGKRD